ncbi:hypothetical protein BVJ53_13145 [Lacticaseibacillus chiayiensis]|uniref:Uncharacterized protein n=1 Tax=Lacticaseibacillus chiayiensis TaxID=2100821 RepID=A0A4Q1TL13_9LACO|nr:hypothetical protein BVJ53_13145 [Lacticaseibacillus chiayiensis]
MKRILILLSVSLGLVTGGTLLSPTHTAEASVTPGYYSPFSSISDNIECRNGYPYTMANMRNGKCRVNWDTVVGNVINNTINSAIGGTLGQHLP